MLTKYYPPILRRTHDMIEQHRNIVTFVYILAFCHSPPLPKKPERSKLRGIRPVASEKGQQGRAIRILTLPYVPLSRYKRLMNHALLAFLVFQYDDAIWITVDPKT